MLAVDEIQVAAAKGPPGSAARTLLGDAVCRDQGREMTEIFFKDLILHLLMPAAHWVPKAANTLVY